MYETLVSDTKTPLSNSEVLFTIFNNTSVIPERFQTHPLNPNNYIPPTSTHDRVNPLSNTATVEKQNKQVLANLTNSSLCCGNIDVFEEVMTSIIKDLRALKLTMSGCDDVSLTNQQIVQLVNLLPER
jgi:hypothetical protein|tara:strand:+ start:556 stop:939 length:384 start_codon:yes stop_codon:yes gene_type:complete